MAEISMKPCARNIFDVRSTLFTVVFAMNTAHLPNRSALDPGYIGINSTGYLE